MRIATRTKLLQLHAIWMLPFVFGQRVVAFTTYRASQCDIHPHADTSSIC
jgi:hypothetical protein